MSSAVLRVAYVVRNVLSRKMFPVLREHCRGDVLDIGGRTFYRVAKSKGFSFTHWTILEQSAETLPEASDDLTMVIGDGCAMEFADGSFDTILNIQVLEHVLRPIDMVSESARVLRPGGHGIFLIPQTSYLHLTPHHYGNFTRYWIEKIMPEHGLDIVELRPLGGFWSSMFSHAVYLFLHALRLRPYQVPEAKRPPLFYVLFPFMAVFAVLIMPFCLLFSLGDLAEDAPNHLVVVKKQLR